MIDVKAKQDALELVTGAASIHSNGLRESLGNDRSMSASFKEARQRYINKLEDALRELRGVAFADGAKLDEQVKDLSLAESVKLLHAVQDHMRTLV